MYIGVDVGGTKTLVAVLDEHGVIKESTKFPTPKKYDNFLLELRHTLAHFKTHDFKAGGIAIPGRLDRRHGRAITLGNLSWKNIPVQRDLEHICHCPFVLENDAKLGGLSEAMLLKNEYRKVLYITVSTGVGVALICDGVIDTSIGDGGGRALLLEHKGRLMAWEDFAGGRAIVKQYGKQAAEITDVTTWTTIARELTQGLQQLIAITTPEVVVIGGSVGTYFDRYGKLLAAELKKHELPIVTLPHLMGAQRPEEAVVYGCYDLAKQTYGHAKTHH